MPFANFDLKLYLIRILVLFLSISVHEWAHAYSAYRYGDDTAALQGRLTLSPLRHFEPIGMMLILLGAPIAWARPVPVNPGRFRPDVNRRKAILLVSMAGIICNLLLAFGGGFFLNLFMFLGFQFRITGIPGVILEVLQTLMLFMLYTNVYLAVFNLLPIPQLDGFELFSRVLPKSWVWWLQSNARIISLVMLSLIVFFRRPFGVFLDFIAAPFFYIFTKPWELLFNLLLGH